MEINLFLFSIFICIFLFLYLFLYFCGEMKVIVHVREKVVQVQCGPGTQRLKWLGHVGTGAKSSQIADMVLIHYLNVQALPDTTTTTAWSWVR
jgi:hypothetical protein